MARPKWVKGQSGNPGGRPRGIQTHKAAHRRRTATAEEFIHKLDAVIAEMTEALASGALFNPEMFGSMLKETDNPILRWRAALMNLRGGRPT